LPRGPRKSFEQELASWRSRPARVGAESVMCTVGPLLANCGAEGFGTSRSRVRAEERATPSKGL
jgi:hypothetical protein